VVIHGSLCLRAIGHSTETGAAMQLGRATASGARRALLAALWLALAASQAADPAVWPTQRWQTSSPEEQGMAPAALADLVDFGAANAMDSLLVARHGTIVLDAHYAPFRPGMKHAVNSVTKGVVGTLAGIAFKQGKLGQLDAPVLDFFPGRSVANSDARKKAMTVQSLLDSDSGLSWREPLSDEPPETMLQMERSADWIGFVLDRPMAQMPGVSFNYDSGTWHLLSAIIGRQTGSDALEYARQNLFAPLGITDVAWRRDPQGIPIGGYGLFMQPRDMAKIGHLYLRGGQWDGQQVLPPQWVANVFDAQVEMRLGAFRYANGWWTLPERGAAMAVGFLCQLIIVLPEIDTVVVATGRGRYPPAQLLDRVVNAAQSDAPLPRDAVGSARLADRIADASVEKRSPVAPTPSLASAISGKTYRFAPNVVGLRSLKLDLAPANARYDSTYAAASVDGATRRFEGPIGLDGTFRVREAQGVEPLLAVKGNWLGDNALEIVVRSLLEGIVTSYVLTFDGPRVDVALADNRGVRARFQGQASD
jgi:CubicO group peptidase (beta-lactamase class C family)